MGPEKKKLKTVTVRVYEQDVRDLKAIAATQATAWHFLLRETLHLALKERRRASGEGLLR